MKSLFFAGLILVLGIVTNTNAQQPAIEPGVPLALAKWRAANYSNVHYKLDITLKKGVPLMTGTVEIGVDLTEEGAKYPLVLDWRTTPFATDKDQPYAKVLEVNGLSRESRDASGTLALRSIENEHLLIPNGLLKTGTNTIKIEFASPIKTSGAAVTRYIDKQDGGEYIYSLFVPSDASMAFPVFDQPDLKARFQLTLTVPLDWQTISNTRSSRSTEPSKLLALRREVFQETKPISTYVFAFAAGDFIKFSDPANPKSQIPNPKSGDVYVRRSQAEKFKQHEKEVFRLNREAVKYLEDYFDYKFPFPKYDLVLIPEFPFGGMEHAGATFLRETSVIFPSEPTKNDFVARASVIFHEAAHQWFGDTVTMKWFDDLWLKEGFATFMAYKAMAKVMPEYNSWKIFYERTKQGAYYTDSTQGTTPIYQEISNLSAAKSAYGNIVYNKAPAFLKQAEFFLGEEKFRDGVRAFLRTHEYSNAAWTDLVSELGRASGQNLDRWSQTWVTRRGMPVFRMSVQREASSVTKTGAPVETRLVLSQNDALGTQTVWPEKLRFLYIYADGSRKTEDVEVKDKEIEETWSVNLDARASKATRRDLRAPLFVFPNFEDFGYGTFLLDDQSRAYVLKNIQLEKDDFLRSMMWGSLWDSVRQAEFDPSQYVELVIKNIKSETDESTIQTLLGRAGTAMNYYIGQSVPSASAGGRKQILSSKIESALLERIANAPTIGQRITYYRAFLNLGSSANARQAMKEILAGTSRVARFELRTKDRFDIVTRLLILGDTDAPALLANLERTETSDEARRYAYAARAGIGTAENKAKYWNDFVNNKDISESWIEAAFAVFNNSRHADLTAPYLARALAELPKLKRNRKIFFVNNWLGSFIGGQRGKESLDVVTKFLAVNKDLDRDLRLKILENVDGLERAVKIRAKFGR